MPGPECVFQTQTVHIGCDDQGREVGIDHHHGQLIGAGIFRLLDHLLHQGNRLGGIGLFHIAECGNHQGDLYQAPRRKSNIGGQFLAVALVSEQQVAG